MTRVELVISDVDGTLLTHDKRLTEGALQSVRRLSDKGIGFTVTSSRPLFGMQMLVEPLDLRLPIGAFNGCLIAEPTFNILHQSMLPQAVAQASIAMLEQSGVDIWLFTSDHWYIQRDDGAYVLRERNAIRTEPIIIPDFKELIGRTCKIVGVSGNPEKLAGCERMIRAALGTQASVAQSQTFYLDITAAGHDKGTFLELLGQRLNVSLQNIVTIGDMSNDVAMFRKSGISFAMGNASSEVKTEATYVTDDCDHEGFTKAIDKILALST